MSNRLTALPLMLLFVFQLDATTQNKTTPVRVSLTGIFLHKDDYAAVRIGKQECVVELKDEQQRKQAAKFIGEKVDINATLARGSARDRKQLVIRLLSIQQVVHAIRFLANEDGSLKAIWFDEVKKMCGMRRCSSNSFRQSNRWRSSFGMILI